MRQSVFTAVFLLHYVGKRLFDFVIIEAFLFPLEGTHAIMWYSGRRGNRRREEETGLKG